MDSTGAAQLALNDAAAAEVTFSVLTRVSPRDPIAVAQQAVAMARQPSKQQAAITLLTGQVTSASACPRAMCLLHAHELRACCMLTSYVHATSYVPAHELRACSRAVCLLHAHELCACSAAERLRSHVLHGTAGRQLLDAKQPGAACTQFMAALSLAPEDTEALYAAELCRKQVQSTKCLSASPVP